MDYAIWDLNGAELVSRPRRGLYELSPAGRASAEQLAKRRLRRSPVRTRAASGRVSGSTAPQPAADGKRLGRPYQPANVNFRSREPALFAYDPDERDRRTRAHHRLQEQAAALLRRLGFEPRSPLPSEPQFDLAYDEERRITVIEVKSLPEPHVAAQIRLGLGQVLEYAVRLSSLGAPVRPVLLVERRPSRVWTEVSDRAGVLLAWPQRLRDALQSG